METLAVALGSLAFALYIGIKKNNNPLFISFAALCLTITCHKAGLFLYNTDGNQIGKIIYHAGFLIIPPFLINFTRLFLPQQTILSKRDVALAAAISCMLCIIFFTPVYQWSHVDKLFFLYNGFIVLYCFVALLNSFKDKSSEIERKKAGYIIISCIIAVIISLSDIFHYAGYPFPRLSDLAVLFLLYFIVIILIHTDLPELYNSMFRALIHISIACLITLFLRLLAVIPLKNSSDIFLASLLLIICIDPLRRVFQKAYGYIFFQNSSITLPDEEVEKEKALLLEEMATGLAHEIRNPLGSIKSAAQCLKSSASTSENFKFFDIIIEETDRLNGVVSQFLNYARPYSMNQEPQDVNRIIEKVLALIRTAHTSTNIRFEKQLAPDLPHVIIDGEQMIQVILNMAYNSIEAMPAGGTLTFSTSRLPGSGKRKIDITIRNTGTAIRKEDLPHIFKPFFTTKKKGTGLGLSICQKIIKNHGGTIVVTSAPGQGTAFSIRI